MKKITNCAPAQHTHTQHLTNSSLYIQMQALHSANDSLANAALWYNQNAATEAVNNNNIANGNTNYTANQKIVNAVYARTAAIGKTLSSADSLTIKNIAQQCLSYGGPAVLEARSLYSLVDANYSFSNIPCSMGSRWSLNEEGDENTPDILLYPNPASETIILNFSNNNNSYVVRILDVIGNTVMEKTLTPFSPIDINELKAGVYIAKVHHNAGVFTAKFTVVK